MRKTKKVVRFPSYNISTGDAILIVKFHLDDPNIALQSKVLSIAHVADLETYNSVSKADLAHALRWLFEHYEF